MSNPLRENGSCYYEAKIMKKNGVTTIDMLDLEIAF